MKANGDINRIAFSFADNTGRSNEEVIAVVEAQNGNNLTMCSRLYMITNSFEEKTEQVHGLWTTLINQNRNTNSMFH